MCPPEEEENNGQQPPVKPQRQTQPVQTSPTGEDDPEDQRA